MGNRHITRKYQTRILRTDREGLIRFLDRLRDLESESRDAYIISRSDYYDSEIRSYTRQLESELEGLRISAAENLERVKSEHRKIVENVTDATQMRAVFNLTPTSKETYSGTPREIVEHNNFSKAQNVHIQPSGQFIGPVSIDVSRSGGVVIELSTSDSELFERASVSIPAWLKEVSGPGQFAYHPVVPPILWSLLSGLNVALLMDRENTTLMAIVWSMIGFVSLYYTIRFLIYPQVQIREEPRSAIRYFKWIGYVLGTIALGIIGTFIYEQIK